MNTRKKARSMRLLSLLLTFVMLLSMLPLSAVPVSAEDAVSTLAAETHPTEVGSLKTGQEMCYFTDQDGTLKQNFVSETAIAGSTPTQKWGNFRKGLPVGHVGGNGMIRGIAYYDAASGTLFVEGQINCNEYVGTVAKECPDVLNVVATGDTTMVNGWYGQDCEGLSKLSITLQNDAKLTVQYDGDKFTSNAALNVSQTSHQGTVGTAYWRVVDRYYPGAFEVRGTGKLEVIVPESSGAFYGIYAKTVSILEHVSLSVEMGIKNVGEKYDIPSAIRCDTLNIDTTGTVDISAAIEPPPLAHHSDYRWYYYAYTPLYGNRTSETYGLNVINAGRITLKAKDSNWLLNKDQLAEDHKEGICEYICDSIRAKEGWTVTETAAGTDTPYILQFTSPAYVEPDSHPFTVGSLENEMGYYVSGQTDLVNVAPGTVLGSRDRKSVV